MLTVLDSLDKKDKAGSVYEQEQYTYYAAIYMKMIIWLEPHPTFSADFTGDIL